MSEGEPLGCPLATVKQPTTLSSSRAGLPGSSGHVPRGPGSAGLQDPAPPLPASSRSWSCLSSTCIPSPAPSASHALGPRGPSLALAVISWALWETQGDRVPIGVHSPQPRSHRSLFPPTPHPPPRPAPLPRPPGLPQLPRQGGHWLTTGPVCRPLPAKYFVLLEELYPLTFFFQSLSVAHLKSALSKV